MALEIIFVAPQSAKKKLNDIAGAVNAINKEANTFFARFAKPGLKKKLEALYAQLIILIHHYGADPQFAVLAKRVELVLKEIAEKHGINLAAPQPKEVPYPVSVRQGLDKAQRILDSLQALLNRIPGERLKVERIPDKKIDFDRRLFWEEKIVTVSRSVDQKNDLLQPYVSNDDVRVILKKWQGDYQKFLQDKQAFFSKKQGYIQKIESCIYALINPLQEKLENACSELEKSIAMHVKLCNGAVEWPKIVISADKLVKLSEPPANKLASELNAIVSNTRTKINNDMAKECNDLCGIGHSLFDFGNELCNRSVEIKDLANHTIKVYACNYLGNPFRPKLISVSNLNTLVKDLVKQAFNLTVGKSLQCSTGKEYDEDIRSGEKRLPENAQVKDLIKDDKYYNLYVSEPFEEVTVPLSAPSSPDGLNDSGEYTFKVTNEDKKIKPFTLKFGKGDTVAKAKIEVAKKLNLSGPEYVTLQFGGKPLKEAFVISRLRIGEEEISVFMKDNSEVLLLTAKSML
ncbi:MAG: hypothetical protein LBR79_04690 [Oscillospiraceae bacterium]|jgi:hypothetical protein|nr:hypothetical protein [Oscillospiraceae bacterium]